MPLKGLSGFLAALMLLMVVPPFAWSAPPKSATTGPSIEPKEEQTQEEENDNARKEETGKRESSGVLRLMCSEVMPFEVSWQGEKYATWPGDALQVPPGEATLRVKARGYFPRQAEVLISNSAVTSLQVDLEPIPDYEWMAVSGWVGLGLGLVLSVGAIAVQDSVEFDSPGKRETAQWILLGSGGTLLLTGGILAKEAYSRDQQAPARSF